MLVRRGPLSAFIAAYLAVQLFLPLRGFAVSRFDSRGSFGWNMFSQLYFCRVVYLRRGQGDRAWAPVAYAQLVRQAQRLTDVCDRERLHALNEWLCTRETGVAYEALVQCNLNRGPDVTLVQPEVDICKAPNYGVLP